MKISHLICLIFIISGCNSENESNNQPIPDWTFVGKKDRNDQFCRGIDGICSETFKPTINFYINFKPEFANKKEEYDYGPNSSNISITYFAENTNEFVSFHTQTINVLFGKQEVRERNDSLGRSFTYVYTPFINRNEFKIYINNTSPTISCNMDKTLDVLEYRCMNQNDEFVGIISNDLGRQIIRHNHYDFTYNIINALSLSDF